MRRHLAPDGQLVLHLFDPRLDMLIATADAIRHRSDDAAALPRVMALRWTYRWELRHLLELCGLAVEAEYGDFTGSAPAYGQELIVVARSG